MSDEPMDVTAGVADGAAAELLCFLLAGQEYAIDILAVAAVLELAEATPLPNMPECVKGVICWHDEVVPVIELAPLLGPPHAATGNECMVVLELGSAADSSLVACVVDAVSGVANYGERDVTVLTAGELRSVIDTALAGS